MHIRHPVEWLFDQFGDVTEEVGTASPAEYWPATHAADAPMVGRITTADIKASLKSGLQDFAAARTDVIFMCLIYPIIGLFIAAVTARGELLPLLFPTATGFALIGPLFAVGLYEMSRRRELTGKIRWLDTFAVLRSPAIVSIICLGLVLIGIFLLWLATAQAIFNLTLGPVPPASIAAFATALFTTTAGWAMIGIGMAAGGIFAVSVLAISAVSFPLLLDHPVGIATAINTSLQAVRHNPGPMALWGLIVATGLFLGSLPCFIGLVVVLPILGHATWHLYRHLVRK
jgi:uncharacterized membrane protein